MKIRPRLRSACGVLATFNRQLSAFTKHIANRQLLPLWAAFLFLAALIPRLAALGRYVTPDEPIWVSRILGFREALLAGDWASTIQSGHPGATLTWLGAAAVQLQLWLQPDSREHVAWLNQLYWLSPDNGPAFQRLAVFLTAARMGPILVAALGVVMLYFLLRSRLGNRAAVLGALFIALDPFTAGLSGLLHLDALLATFMLAAVLPVLPPVDAQAAGIKPFEVVFSGIMAALAVLTKTPGLFLLPVIPLILFWRMAKPASRNPGERFAKLLSSYIKLLFYWGAAFLIVILILLPAVWAAPERVLETVGVLTTRLSGSGDRPVFFLGEFILNPGPEFYPLVILFRLAPAVMVGLLPAAVFIISPFVKRRNKIPANILWLCLFSVGYLLFMNLSAERFDRYTLPAVLPLLPVAAWGITAAANRWRKERLLVAVPTAFVLLQLAYLAASWPFPLTAYNWLAGGTAVAQHVFPADWGEAASVAADWLAENEPDSQNKTLFAGNIPAAATFFPGRLLPLTSDALPRLKPDDLLLYVSQDWQGGPASFEVNEGRPNLVAAANRPPVERFAFNGLERAVVYSGLSPADFGLAAIQSRPRLIHFEDKVSIVSAGALPASWPDDVNIAIGWQTAAAGDYHFRLDLRDMAGDVWASHEQILLNQVEHPTRYWPAGETQEVFYILPLPPDLPPGEYTVQVTLFDSQGARLGVFGEDGRFAGVMGQLASLTIPAPENQPPIEPPNQLDSGPELAGYGPLPEQAGTGEPLKLDLWWRQSETTLPTGQLLLSIGPGTAEQPLDTHSWQPEQLYHIRPSWRVPAALDSGRYALTLQWLDENGRPQWPEPVELGQIEIIARARAFDLPPDLTPLQVQLGTMARLQEAAAEVAENEIILTVTWQAVEPDGVFYTTFVHLLDEAGSTVNQADRPPVEPTHTWVPGQVVREQYRLPRPPSGRYTIALGLYDQTNGRRLPVYSAAGDLLPNEQYLLEVAVP